MEKGEIVSCGLLETRSNGAEALDVVEEDLDAVASSVPTTVEARLLLAARVRVNDGLDLQLPHSSTDRVRIVTRVSYKRLTSRIFRDDRFGDGRLMLLTLRELDMDGTPFCVNERVDLRGESTSRVTQRITDDPPFPPAASWWARTTDASMMTPSSSTCSCKALKIAAQCPRCAQFEKRLNTVFQAPKRSGRSRHGMPVFARYSTASMNVRSSSFGAGPRRFGTTMLTIVHCASVKAWRGVTPSFDHAWSGTCKSCFASHA